MREAVVIPAVLDKDQPYLAEKVGPNQIAQGRTISIVNAKGNSVVPLHCDGHAEMVWDFVLFLLTLLAAAMSALSSQFHTLGTAVGG